MKIKLSNILLLASTSLMMACSCQGKVDNPDGSSGIDVPDTPGIEQIVDKPVAYVTTADRSRLFESETLEFGNPSSMSPNQIKLNFDEKYQTVDGFGAALTVSSCYNLLKMPEELRMSFLKTLFSRSEGAGSSLIRVCIGGSDFSWDYGDSGLSYDGRFTWCDSEGMENFAPHPMDVKYVVPILKEIYKINPDVKIIGSPWTAPRWMKEEYSWTGSHLKRSCYADYAQYFVKWIQHMQSQGFNIHAITLENEPLNAGNSMSMLMYWDEARDFVKVLGPAFKEAGISTKIEVFDHNYNYDNVSSQKSYPLNIYADPEASKYIAGSAWHNYGGNVAELDNIVAAAPEKDIYFTEASIGEWNYTFEGCLIHDFRDIFLGTLSRGGKGVTLWNLMLDDKKGPYTNAGGSCTTCYGAVTLMSADGKTVEPYTHYYQIVHASKVIAPGAVRIGTSGSVSGINSLVFANTDGSVGAIILNDGASAQNVVYVTPKHSIRYNIPAKSIVSLGWKE